MGAEAKSVTVKGVSVPGGSLPVEGGGFGGLVTLDKGENTIQLTAAPSTPRSRYSAATTRARPRAFSATTYMPGSRPWTARNAIVSAAAPYDFSRNVPAASTAPRPSATGNKMATEQYVHGPVGAGVCISCHNPHGSFRKNQLARTTAPCAWSATRPSGRVQKRRWCIRRWRKAAPPAMSRTSPRSSSSFGARRARPSVHSASTAMTRISSARSSSTARWGAGDCIACHNAHASDIGETAHRPQGQR